MTRRSKPLPSVRLEADGQVLREIVLGGEAQPLKPTVLQLGDLPEADALRVKPPLCPACGGRLTRMPGAAWMAYCSRRQCPRRLAVEATWVPGQWIIVVPD